MQQKTRSLIFTSLGHYLNDSFLVLFPILSIYYLGLGISAIAIGIFGGVYNVMSGALGAPIGQYADKKGNYAYPMFLGFLLIGASIFAFSIAFLDIGIVMRYITVAVAAILLGTGLAFYHPLGGAILQSEYAKEDAPKALGINGSFGSLGRAIAPYALVVIIGIIGTFTGMIMLTVIDLLVAIVVFAGLRGVRHPVARKATQQSGNIKPYMYIILPLTIIVFTRSIFISGVQLFSPSFIDLIYKSTNLTGLFLTASYSTAIIGQPLFGNLTSRYGGRSIIIITTAFSTLFFILFLLIRGIYFQLLFFSLFAFFAFSGFPNLLGYVSQVVDSSVYARANGIVWSFGNMMGGALGMVIGGPLIEYIGFTGTMWIYAAVALISVAMLVLLPRKNRN
ncbi:MAG: MFS transporter [Nitrososphaerota archaeon]|nr:MFS transporter [Nitrososphaerota archaeon]MDG6930415.1 MFS transporter [Nitrososphaerota archaeon]